MIGKSYPESRGLIFESVRAHANIVTITASAGMESGIRMDKGAVSGIIDAQLTRSRSKGLIGKLRMPRLHYQISYVIMDVVDKVRSCAC